MPFFFTAKSVKGLELGVYTLFRVCENVLCFDSHALPTINIIMYRVFYRSCLWSRDICDLSEHDEVNMAE